MSVRHENRINKREVSVCLVPMSPLFHTCLPVRCIENPLLCRIIESAVIASSYAIPSPHYYTLTKYTARSRQAHDVVYSSSFMAEFPDSDSKNPLTEACTRCSSLVESRECISWGVGPRNADLVVVGEAPGAGTPDAERWKGGNWTGMAYTARHSGRKIREMLADINYSDAYYTNAVKCFPSDGAGSNREPTAEERENCRPYLVREIEQIAPTCVVATGKHATQTLLAVEGRTIDGFIDRILEPIACPTLGVPVLPILHPSYQEVWLSRLGYTRESYLDAIQSAIEAAK